MRRALAAVLGSTLIVGALAAAPFPGKTVPFDVGWLFRRGDFASASLPAFDDAGWCPVSLPHDWSVEEPFRPDLGSGNGYAAGGIGWYRNRFGMDPSDADKIVSVEFDGIYDNSEVWVNGHFAGRRPYGYSSVCYEISPYLKFGDGENVIAVRVDHSRFADSRWYTGSGIYRHARLRVTNRVRIMPRGVFVTTPEVGEARALVRIVTRIENRSGGPRSILLKSEIVDSQGRPLVSAAEAGLLPAGSEKVFDQTISLDKPDLWSPDSPALHSLISRLVTEGHPVDEVATTFGIRSIRFDPDRGFFLNGRPAKLKGVCLHHDAGSLGAAVPEKVWARRLGILKDLGANAVRTSHNPPAPEFLDLCDRLGFFVQDEAFDEFTPAKNKWVSGWNEGVPSRFGYAEDFERWSVADIRDMILRDRNHPSIVMWSIGNEIDYPNDPFSHPVLGAKYRPENPPAENLVKWAGPLVEAVKALDPTRPVTAALAHIPMSEAAGLTGLLDVVGYNYQEARYAGDHAVHPSRIIYGSENGRDFGAWTAVRDNDYVAGQFLWTGVDYLGEAGLWPNRANGSGLIDLCGFRKPAAWFRRSLWLDDPVVFLCAEQAGIPGPRGLGAAEHWNWPDKAKVTVICYTNCEAVEITLNERIVAVKRASDAVEGALSVEIPFEPGVLRAVGRRGGRQVSQFSLRTAGPARRIEIVPDSAEIVADGLDVCHIEFRIVDEHGVRVPDAANELTFAVEGPGRILGIDNGDLDDVSDPKDLVHKAFRGRGLAILRSLTDRPGSVLVTITSPGLERAIVKVESKLSPH